MSVPAQVKRPTGQVIHQTTIRTSVPIRMTPDDSLDVAIASIQCGVNHARKSVSEINKQDETGTSSSSRTADAKRSTLGVLSM